MKHTVEEIMHWAKEGHSIEPEAVLELISQYQEREARLNARIKALKKGYRTIRVAEFMDGPLARTFAHKMLTTAEEDERSERTE